MKRPHGVVYHEGLVFVSDEEEHREVSLFERAHDGRWLFRDTLQRAQVR